MNFTKEELAVVITALIDYKNEAAARRSPNLKAIGSALEKVKASKKQQKQPRKLTAAATSGKPPRSTPVSPRKLEDMKREMKDEKRQKDRETWEEGTSAKDSMLVDAGIKSRSILTERKSTDSFYMCKFCNKKFDDKEKADKHMKICAKKAENT